MTTSGPAVPALKDLAPASLEAAVQRYLADFPAIRASLERERRKYAEHLVPLEELRVDLDAALGERSLTKELDKMRGCQRR